VPTRIRDTAEHRQVFEEMQARPQWLHDVQAKPDAGDARPDVRVDRVGVAGGRVGCGADSGKQAPGANHVRGVVEAGDADGGREVLGSHPQRRLGEVRVVTDGVAEAYGVDPHAPVRASAEEIARAVVLQLSTPPNAMLVGARLRQAGFSFAEAATLAADRRVTVDDASFAAVLVEGGVVSPFEALVATRKLVGRGEGA
jgi:hypothetical protein